MPADQDDEWSEHRTGMCGRRLAARLASGQRTQVACGLSVGTDAPPTAHHALVQAAVAVHRGIVWLRSAFSFHAPGMQRPHRAWLAVDVQA